MFLNSCKRSCWYHLSPFWLTVSFPLILFHHPIFFNLKWPGLIPLCLCPLNSSPKTLQTVDEVIWTLVQHGTRGRRESRLMGKEEERERERRELRALIRVTRKRKWCCCCAEWAAFNREFSSVGLVWFLVLQCLVTSLHCASCRDGRSHSGFLMCGLELFFSSLQYQMWRVMTSMGQSERFTVTSEQQKTELKRK